MSNVMFYDKLFVFDYVKIILLMLFRINYTLDKISHVIYILFYFKKKYW